MIVKLSDPVSQSGRLAEVGGHGQRRGHPKMLASSTGRGMPRAVRTDTRTRQKARAFSGNCPLRSNGAGEREEGERLGARQERGERGGGVLQAVVEGALSAATAVDRSPQR